MEAPIETCVERLAVRLRRDSRSRDVLGNPFRARRAAREQAIAATERRLGCALPPTLRAVYRNVANGGFGPGYGVMGANGGFTDDLGNTVADLYASYRQPDPADPTWQWPERYLPICHWGCAVYSTLDCALEPAPVFWADVGAKEPNEPMEMIFRLHRPSFDTWLTDWLDSKNLWSGAES